MMYTQKWSKVRQTAPPLFNNFSEETGRPLPLLPSLVRQYMNLINRLWLNDESVLLGDIFRIFELFALHVKYLISVSNKISFIQKLKNVLHSEWEIIKMRFNDEPLLNIQIQYQRYCRVCLLVDDHLLFTRYRWLLFSFCFVFFLCHKCCPLFFIWGETNWRCKIAISMLSALPSFK